MDSNTEASQLLQFPSILRAVYHQPVKNNVTIDLGLSLSTLQSEAYRSSDHFVNFRDYEEVMNGAQLSPYMKCSHVIYPMDGDKEEETEVDQREKRFTYIKVYMEGVIVGRKICIFDHDGYFSLALRLEDMFGTQSLSGLRLFQGGSEFSLFYKDRDENWRVVGDVPWKEFGDRVKRLKIVRNNKPLFP